MTPAAGSPSSDAQAGGANEDMDSTPRPASPVNISSPSPSMSTSPFSHRTTASNVSIGSSAPTSFASITEDTSDTSSIQLDHPLRRHSETSACDMAALPPFVRDNLRNFFSGGQLQTAPAPSGHRHVSYDDQENMPPAAGTDGDVRIATNKAQNASPSSMTSEDAQVEFDAIERDIDTLKRHVADMRSESLSGRSTPTMNQTQSKSPSTRTRIPGPVVHPKESAAARLQREHEQLEQKQMRATASRQAKPAPPPPSSYDFPELVRPDTQQRPRAFTADGNEGKPSYANMATTGMMDAISKRFTSSGGTHGNAIGTTSRTTRGSFTSSTNPGVTAMEEDEARYIDERNENADVSPRSPKGEHALTTRGQPPSLMGRSPRFAQPTKSYSQRTDATMRKDSVTSKVSPVGSPAKSGRALHQHHTKRSALPGGWLSSPEVSPTTDVYSSSIVDTMEASSPSSQERWQVIGHTSTETATNPESALRKKTSSYMSPTKATTLRNFATLGQENVKHTSPRVKKKPVARIDTAVSPVVEASTSAISRGQCSAISGTTFTESTVSSPDVDIYTESRAVEPWDPHQTHAGSSGGFGEGEFTWTYSLPGEWVKTKLVPQTSFSVQHPRLSSSIQQAAATKTGSSHAVPIVQPKTFTHKPMPHKLPASRRSTIDPLGPVAEDVAAKAKAAGLRMPANTVAKRRESHGHLLSPITSKLEHLGLLKRQPADANSPITSQIAPFSTAMQHVRQLLPETPQRSSPPVSVVVLPEPQVRTKAVPPHLRRKHNTSSDDESTTSQNVAIALSGNDGPKSGSVELDAQRLHTPSLRATAQEFTPMWKPKTIEQELGLLDWEGWFSYRSAEEWNALHPGIRAAIQAIRDYKCKGGRPPTGTFPGMTPTKIRSKTANQRFWANLMHNHSPASSSDSSTSMTPSNVVAAMQESIAQYDNSGSVQAGQVLQPEVSPDTNSTQWVMQGPDGRKESVSFGRAAVPEAARVTSDAFGSPNTVTISPVSTETSPRYEATSPANSNRAVRSVFENANHHGWSIASALKDPSGWAIGDGREIRYVGNGNINPGTSYDHVAPYQQGFREGPDQGPRMIGEEQDDGRTSIPLAPRSREQWAKLLPQSRTPCGNIEITQATEQIPFAPMGGPKLYGFCGPCSDNSH